MLLYLFFDSTLATCPKKMETEKWPKAADSPLLCCSLLCYTEIPCTMNRHCILYVCIVNIIIIIIIIIIINIIF